LVSWGTTRVQFNLLDSHDTARVVSIACGDRATLRLATLFQMTFPGTPCVYYGDEIALRGTKRYGRPHRDRDARWPFPWHDQACWDNDMRVFVQNTIRLRHAHPALRGGSYWPCHAASRQYAFVRSDASETLLVALNAGDESATIRVPVAAHFSTGHVLRPLLGSVADSMVTDGHVTLTLPARAGAVFT